MGLEELLPLVYICIGSLIGTLGTLLVKKHEAEIQSEQEMRQRRVELHIELWHSLNDLKKAGDILWDEVNVENVKMFLEQNDKTEEIIDRNSILIPKVHLDELRNLLSAFSNYQKGKERLMAVYDWAKSGSDEDMDISYINKVLKDNRIWKNEYTKLLNELEKIFKHYIGTN